MKLVGLVYVYSVIMWTGDAACISVAIFGLRLALRTAFQSQLPFDFST